jgi:hypothetical protein
MPRFVWGFNDAAGKVQIRELDVSAAAAPVAVTADSFDHVDDFPSIVAGTRTLVGGIDSRAVGAVHQWNGSRYEKVRDITPTSAFANPQMAASFEPFTWNGRAWATFIVLDGGRTPSRFPGEVWLTSLEDGSAPRLVSAPTTAARLDPEYFLGAREAWVFYYARYPSSPGYALRRARLGLVR